MYFIRFSSQFEIDSSDQEREEDEEEEVVEVENKWRNCRKTSFQVMNMYVRARVRLHFDSMFGSSYLILRLAIPRESMDELKSFWLLVKFLVSNFDNNNNNASRDIRRSKVDVFFISSFFFIFFF